MSNIPKNQPGEIPSELDSEFAEICRDFSRKWADAAGDRPTIEAFAVRVANDRRGHLINVLIALEMKQLIQAGETIDQSSYEKRFPSHLAGIGIAIKQAARNATPTLSRLAKAGEDQETHDSAARPVATGDHSQIPTQIGRFKVKKTIGSGAFGVVCLAHDEQLGRNVALKFARKSRFETPEEIEHFVLEARTAAQIEHPGIVTVFDVLQQDELICIVQQYIDGHDLKKELSNSAPTFQRTVEIIRDVSEAIGYAHHKGFVHRDIKPANILIDTNGKPHVTDFGLAVHESVQRRLRGERSGTPRYMSPELVLGETHRLDGRSDLWSLGVVMFEMLTGKPPFNGETAAEVFDEVKNREPKPPRQLNPKIPSELERICLKLLSKRIVDRYTTATDLAVDLGFFLQTREHASRADFSRRSGDSGQNFDSRGMETATAKSNRASTVESAVGPKIVPKGIRPFDTDDSDFYLQLLPGPRDRLGIPDVIRFWLNFVREADPVARQSVGLIYGPSGCGKSSFVKAGLIPQFDSSIVPVYVEATANDTEDRLRRAITHSVSSSIPEPGLSDLLDGIREGMWLPRGKKLLIVIDQFEQWLNNRSEDQMLPLVRAMRQCDGVRVQCILMVRDDFWLATNRFLHALEVDLLEGKNSMLMDLFDKLHSHKVLAEFGRAYGRLPADASELTKAQHEFLDRAIDGLSEDGKIICVHLALFAEMFKGKEWTPTELSKIGGAEGVGFTFFEDTFSTKTSLPECKMHAAAAKKVLGALLPESGADIRGKMQPIEDLIIASGYSERPNAFKDLIRILDRQLRLITLTDPAGIRENESVSGIDNHSAFYQLTHDYLVRPLREWLTQKKKLTMRGRAEIRLTERSELWSTRPTNQYLPSPLEFAQTRSLTSARDWTPAERRMMATATSFYAIRIAIGLFVICAIGWATREAYSRFQADAVVARLLDGETEDLPDVLTEVRRFREWADTRLAAIALDESVTSNPKKNLHVHLGLDAIGGSHNGFLLTRLTSCQPNELQVILSALADDQAAVSEELWKFVTDKSTADSVVLRAAAALAVWDPNDDRWNGSSLRIGRLLVHSGAFEIAKWEPSLRPIRTRLLPIFARELATNIANASKIIELYHSFSREINEPDLALLNEYSKCDLALASSSEELAASASRKAQLFIALVSQGRNENLLENLNSDSDLTFVATVINRMEKLDVDSAVLVRLLDKQSHPSIQGALLLCLSNYDLSDTPFRDALMTKVRGMYRAEPDGYLHSCCEAFLRKAEPDLSLIELRKKFLGMAEIDDRRLDWSSRSPYLTTIKIRAPGKIRISHGREVNLSHSFEISNTEVMLEHFLKFVPEHVVGETDGEYSDGLPPAMDSPAEAVQFHQIAQFCNSLSQEVGLPQDQWCYASDQDAGESQFVLAENYLERNGFRLPTEAEWEFACKSHDENSWSCGTSQELLGDYAWFRSSISGNYVQRPVALLKPNRLGLFDMHGNADEVTENTTKIRADEFATSQKGGSVYVEDRDTSPQRRLSLFDGLTRFNGIRVVRIIRD